MTTNNIKTNPATNNLEKCSTQLVYPYTRQQRIDELKELIAEFKLNGGPVMFAESILASVSSSTDEKFNKWTAMMYHLGVIPDGNCEMYSIIKTRLPEGHTKAERIKELKDLFSITVKSNLSIFIGNLINKINGLTETQYSENIKSHPDMIKHRNILANGNTQSCIESRNDVTCKINTIFELKKELDLAMANMEIAKSLALRYRLEALAKEVIASDKKAITITFEGSVLEAFENMVSKGIIKLKRDEVIRTETVPVPVNSKEWKVDTKIADDRCSVEVSAVVAGSHGVLSWGWGDNVDKVIILHVSSVYQHRPISDEIIAQAKREAQAICDMRNNATPTQHMF